MVVVLPAPGPATISTGPSGARIAAHCSALGVAAAREHALAPTDRLRPARPQGGLENPDDQCGAMPVTPAADRDARRHRRSHDVANGVARRLDRAPSTS